LVKVVASVRDFVDGTCRELFFTDVANTFGLQGDQASALLDAALRDASATMSMFS